MNLSKKKRILISGIGLLLGIILGIGKEYFMAGIVIIASILGALNIGTTRKDKLAWFILGSLFLIGGALTFFCPELMFRPFFSSDLTKSFTIFARIFLIVIGIFIFSQGLKEYK